MKFILKTILLLCTVQLMGCMQYYYIPNMHNVPQLQHRHDVKILAAGSAGEENSSQELQVAYALTPQIGTVANMMFSQNDNLESEGDGYLFEGGLGYFKALSENYVFETYAVGGGGNVTNRFDEGPQIGISSRHFYVQPSFGYTSKHFDAAFSLRFKSLFLGSPTGYDSLDADEVADLDYLRDHTRSFLVEPAITLRAGFRHFKFQFQSGRSYNVTAPDLAQEKFNVGFGIYLDLNKYFWDMIAGKKSEPPKS